MAQLENIEAIEKRLWSAADLLRTGSNYASNEYFMPVMGLIFLKKQKQSISMSTAFIQRCHHPSMLRRLHRRKEYDGNCKAMRQNIPEQI